MCEHVDDLRLTKLDARDTEAGLQDAGDKGEVFGRGIGGGLVDYRCNFADSYGDNVVHDLHDDGSNGGRLSDSLRCTQVPCHVLLFSFGVNANRQEQKLEKRSVIENISIRYGSVE